MRRCKLAKWGRGRGRAWGAVAVTAICTVGRDPVALAWSVRETSFCEGQGGSGGVGRGVGLVAKQDLTKDKKECTAGCHTHSWSKMVWRATSAGVLEPPDVLPELPLVPEAPGVLRSLFLHSDGL